jgi:hypothetical protein
MSNIELPRRIEAYFAFAELTSTESGRRFTITFTYFEGARLDRLQWWWQVSVAQERGGDVLLTALRNEAIGRFRVHIERWLVNSQRRLTGGDPFPLLESVAQPATSVLTETIEPAKPGQVLSWPANRVANG